jgi:molecular chaperone HscC
VQAGLKARDAALREVVLTDVCPFSLGVSNARRLADNSLERGLFSPIIERNTPIPASRVRPYHTVVDNQTKLHFDIYQGEARMVSDNVKIGEIVIPMRPGPAGQRVDIRFTYDINGLLEVDVHVPAHDARWQIVIAGADESDAADLQRRRAALATLKVHPRELEASKAVLARAERCWQDALGESRDMVEAWIRQFQSVLSTQDPREAKRACENLNAALDRFEGAIFL